MKVTRAASIPLILSDQLLVSRPCTYIDFMVEKKNADNVQLDFIVSAEGIAILLLEVFRAVFLCRCWQSKLKK